MKKLVLAGFLLAGILAARAQTISLTSANPTLTTVGGSSSVRIGDGSGSSLTTGFNSTFVGKYSGQINTTGFGNSLFGYSAGRNITTGFNNTSIGGSAGEKTTTGANNVYVGTEAGFNEILGYNNTYLGFQAGRNNTSGENTMIGYQAGLNSTQNNNTIIGNRAGSMALNSNVMIGNSAGENAVVAHQLFIDNSNTATPLIWGDFWNDQLKFNAKVNIGSNPFPTNTLYSTYQLFVKGGILTDEVRVALSTATGWADYVFAKDYNLKPLSEVEKFINANGHLPNVPSAAEVKQDGIALGDMSRIQQEKIEELTLYIIAQNKRLEALEAKLNNK